MAEPHVIGALRNKRAELAGMLRQLEQQLGQQRANLAHVDATMRLFDPDIRPKDIRPKQPRERNAWFRPGECLRLIYDELREATQPVTTRELAERIMHLKAILPADDQRRERIQKTLLASLNRAKQTIARVEIAGVVRWRLIYDELREATQPVTTREIAERIMRVKAIPAADDQRRERVQKTLLASLNRARQTIARVEIAGVVSWQLI